MPTPEPSSTAATVPMIICPTTHNDWDWQVTFETYYSDGTGSGSTATQPVHDILESVTANFQQNEAPYDQFCFSYAEVGFLRRYLKDNRSMAEVLRDARSRFCLLGGGITSPDNQTCHGEVFIRNYLTGHEFLKEVSLIDNVFFVAWLPDDFGHDPQLPVMIEALGMNSIALSRIPGSPQPTPCTDKQPAAGDVRESGISFYWPGNDGSNVLTHFMPSTYYGITNGLRADRMKTSTEIKQGIQNFLNANYDGVVWPGGTIFATEGGDWQYPISPATGGTPNGAYDWADVNGATVSSSSGGVTASCTLGTFADYYNALMASASEIREFVLYAENYWTGYFASRPQLKIDHYRSAQLLIGAEVLASILAVYAGTTPQDRAELEKAIWQGWHLLVPTSHHDFITGTSPDSVYDPPPTPAMPVWDSNGQLSMSAQTVTLAEDAMSLAMTQLASVVSASPNTNEIPIVVFNQVGSDLPDTALVEMDDPSGGTTDYMVRIGESLGYVQRSSKGTLLFQVPKMQSMSYKVVYLVALGGLRQPAQPADATGVVTMSNNGLVTLTLSEDDGWAITELTIGGDNYVQQDGTYANRIGVWTDTGNIYQFGMEFLNTCDQGTFSCAYLPNGVSGEFVEFGPIRWRFIGTLDNGYTVQYDLVNGETLVHMTTTGSAPSGTSVLTSFSMQTPLGQVGNVLEYGTSYYWESRNPEQSWDGLTFRASRNFAQLSASEEVAIAAIYHNGIPAWTIDGSTLRGCLLRNTPAGGRGASGHDNDEHTQRYTLDVQGQLAVTGHPLRMSLYTQTPLLAMEVAPATAATMRESAQLASVVQSDAVLRVGKMNPPSDGDIGSLILRIQQSRMGAQRLDIKLPFLASGGTRVWPEIVTALETIPENAPEVTLAETTASFQANRALWTMRVPVTAPGTR